MSDESPLHVQSSGHESTIVRWRFEPRVYLTLTAAVLLVVGALAVVRGTSTMLTRITIGLLIALALYPVVQRLERRLGGRRALAVAVVSVVILLVAGAVIAFLGPRAVTEVQQFSQQFPATVGELEKLPLVGGWIESQDLQTKATNWVKDLPDYLTDERLAESARLVLSGVASIAIVAAVAVAVLIDGDQLVRRLRNLLPFSRRRQADEVMHIVYDTVGRYVGGSLTLALMMGLYVLTLGLVLGVPLTPLAAIWAMLTNLIPQVGGALGGGFFVLLAITDSVPTAILAGVLFVLYMTADNHLLQPAIVGKSVDLSPPTTMVAAFMGGALAGVPGALFATPVAGAVKRLYLEARGVKGPDDGSEPRVSLRSKIADALKKLRARFRRTHTSP